MAQSSPNFKFKNGQMAEDKISGVTGVITDRAQNINGSKRYWIQGKATSTNTTTGMWIEERFTKLVPKKK